MALSLHTVAVLVANPALSSILSMTLAGASSLRVRPFDTQVALTTYLHLAPAHLVVADFDNLEAPADRLAEALRADRSLASRNFQIVALASSLSPDAKAASIHAGIDEVIMKPMSPKYLVERVLARLASPLAAAMRERWSIRGKDWTSFGDNVVPLFRQPREHAL